MKLSFSPSSKCLKQPVPFRSPAHQPAHTGTRKIFDEARDCLALSCAPHHRCSRASLCSPVKPTPQARAGCKSASRRCSLSSYLLLRLTSARCALLFSRCTFFPFFSTSPRGLAKREGLSFLAFMSLLFVSEALEKKTQWKGK